MASNSLRRLRPAKLAWDDWGLGNARSVLFAALLGLSLVPVWIVRYPPLQDYPDWLLQAQILRRLHDPAFGFADYYAVLAAPVPNSGSVALIYLFSFLAPIEVAGKLALSVYLLALPLSALYFLRAAQRGRPSAIEFLCPLLAYNYFFYMGYLSYLLGLVLLFLLLGYVWRRWPDPSRANVLVLALGALVLFLVHLIPWATLGFVVGSWGLLWRRRPGGGRVLRWLALAFLPSLGLFAAYAASGAQAVIGVPYPDPFLKLASYVEPLLPAFGLRPWPDIAPPLLVNLVVLTGVGLVAGVAAKAAHRQSAVMGMALLDPTLLSVAFGLLVLITVLPAWLAGVLRPDERLTIPAVLLALGAVRWHRPRWFYDASLAAVCIGMLFFNTVTFARGGSEIERMVNGLIPFVTRQQHPFFLRVPGSCAPAAGDRLLIPSVEPAPRAGFYLSAQRGGNNRQVLDTGLVIVRDPLPFDYRMPWPRTLAYLEQQQPELEANILRDYTMVALIGCPEPVRRVAGLLSASFEPLGDRPDSGSTYLLMLKRLPD